MFYYYCSKILLFELFQVELLSLALVEGEQEGVVGEVVEVSLSAHTHHDIAFNQCHMLPYIVSKLASDFHALPHWKPSLAAGSCAVLDVVGQQPGFSHVQVGKWVKHFLSCLISLQCEHYMC